MIAGKQFPLFDKKLKVKPIKIGDVISLVVDLENQVARI